MIKESGRILPELFTGVRRPKIGFWIILLLGLAIRLHFVGQVDTPLKSDMASFDHRAMALLEQHSFSTDGDRKGLGSSTYRPPLYPMFLAAIYGWFGHAPRNAYIAQSILGALLLVAVYQLGKRIAPQPLQESVGLGAMACCAVYPPLIAYCGILLSETLFMTLLTWSMLALLRPQPSSKRLWLTGLLFGLANLTRPITLPLLLGLLVILILYRTLRVKQALLMMTAFFLTLSPWVIRNYLEFQEVVLVDNSSGINLVAGNNDQAQGDYTRGYETSWMYQDAQKRSKTIVELDRHLIANNNRWIQTHPQRYAQLLLKRLGYYFVSEHEFYIQEYHWNRIPWHKTEYNLTFRLILQVAALLTLIGCLILRFPTGVTIGFAGFFFYVFPAIAMYYTRYRHPCIPFVFILGVLGLAVAIQKITRSKQQAVH